MRILEFRATGITEPDLKQQGRSDQSSGSRLAGGRTTALAKSTILMSAVIVALVVRSTGSRNTAVLEVMTQTGMDMSLARLAVDEAEATNANGQIVASEALDKAQAIKAAAATDPAAALAVRGIHCTVSGRTIAAEIRPATPGITIQVTVSSRDGFYSSDSRQTDSAGKVSFEWPPGGTIGDTGTISVAAVLSGATAASPFTWVRELTQPWEFNNSSK